jgi:hypothetical protein
MFWQWQLPLTLWLCCVAASPASADQLKEAGYRDTGLIRNGGFEEVRREAAGSFVPVHWRKWIYVGEKHMAGITGAAHRGQKCASILLADAKDNVSWVQSIDASRLPRHTSLAVVAYIRTAATEGGAMMVIAPYQGKESAKQIRSDSVAGRQQWQRVVKEFTLPKGTTRFTVSCKLHGTGQAWFDDVFLIYR